MRRKQLFKAVDVVDLTAQRYLVEIEGPPKPVQEESSSGREDFPSSVEVQAEIAQLRQDWMEEKDLLLQQAGEDAEKIRLKVEEEVRAQRQLWAEDQRSQRALLEGELVKLRAQQQLELEQQHKQTQDSLQQLRSEAMTQGRLEGYEQGFESGQAELQRLIRQLHHIISATLHRRQEVIASLETELLDLCFVVVRKVIKRLTSEAQDIIIYNISEALAHLRSRSQVMIHLHPDDMQLASDKKQDFIDAVEKLQGLSLVEDSSLDRGGCLIETDFGEIDATIAGQLRSIEDRIRTSRPLRSQLSGKQQLLQIQAHAAGSGHLRTESDARAEGDAASMAARVSGKGSAMDKEQASSKGAAVVKEQAGGKGAAVVKEQAGGKGPAVVKEQAGGTGAAVVKEQAGGKGKVVKPPTSGKG